MECLPPGIPYPDVTPETLLELWPEECRRQKASVGKCRVLTFHKMDEAHGHFSNWYVHAPFDFEVPSWCQLEGLPPVVPSAFAEKALMLCKAGFFGDAEAYKALINVSFPKDAKDIGAGVQNFDRDAWMQVAASVSVELALQKFGKLDSLRKVLLETGNAILAEAAPSDTVWGIGLKGSEAAAKHPDSWRGTNVLGWGLMEARKLLREQALLADGSRLQAASSGKRKTNRSSD